MAIKTKKISELGQIDVESVDILKKSDFYFLGCMGGVTGKVSTSDVLNAIRANVESISSSAVSTFANSRQTEESSELTEDIVNLKVKIEQLYDKINNLNSNIAKIAELEARCAAFEQFAQALQKDGYLTLAEIKKAAADACPICNHTHEEETTT